MRQVVAALVERIVPCDALERIQIADALEWIASGAPLCRSQQPDTPPKHLVAYFVVVDFEARQVLLGWHCKAQRWLPSGGHVEAGEHPTDTVKREALEELQLEADFLAPLPVFLSVTETVGNTAKHTDVSLWYALRKNHNEAVSFDPTEYLELRWFAFQDTIALNTDPHLGRFLGKLGAYSSSSESSFSGGA